jgi:hypothetical protein
MLLTHLLCRLISIPGNGPSSPILGSYYVLQLFYHLFGKRAVFRNISKMFPIYFHKCFRKGCFLKYFQNVSDIFPEMFPKYIPKKLFPKRFRIYFEKDFEKDFENIFEHMFKQAPFLLCRPGCFRNISSNITKIVFEIYSDLFWSDLDKFESTFST